MNKEDLQKLVTVADSLDSKGFTKEAEEVDEVIQEVITPDAKDKERTTPKKTMKAFKRLYEAAEKIKDGDFDSRGPFRDLFDKARFEAMEICELLKDIEFTPQGEQEAAESGQIEKNIADEQAIEGQEGGAVTEPVAVAIV